MNVHILAIIFMKRCGEVSDGAGRCGGEKSRQCKTDKTQMMSVGNAVSVTSQNEASENIPRQLTAVS